MRHIYPRPEIVHPALGQSPAPPRQVGVPLTCGTIRTWLGAPGVTYSRAWPRLLCSMAAAETPPPEGEPLPLAGREDRQIL